MSKTSSVKVSVIIPSFNASAYIRQTLESVLNQTEQDFEVIVSDDYSTDNTVEVIEEFIKNDVRIKLLKNEQNKGPSYSRNRAISAANGKWIALLDADDYYHKDRLTELINLAEQCNADVVADNIYYVDENGDNPKIAIKKTKQKDKYEIISTDDFIQHDLPGSSGFAYGFLQPIIRNSFLCTHNIKYDETTRLGEDFILSVECLLNGAKFILSHDAYYYYRYVNNSITNNGVKNHLIELSNNNLKLIDSAKKAGHKNTIRLLQYRQKRLAHALLYSDISSQLKRYKIINPLKEIIVNPEAWLFFYMMTSQYIKRIIIK